MSSRRDLVTAITLEYQEYTRSQSEDSLERVVELIREFREQGYESKGVDAIARTIIESGLYEGDFNELLPGDESEDEGEIIDIDVHYPRYSRRFPRFHQPWWLRYIRPTIPVRKRYYPFYYHPYSPFPWWRTGLWRHGMHRRPHGRPYGRRRRRSPPSTTLTAGAPPPFKIYTDKD